MPAERRLRRGSGVLLSVGAALLAGCARPDGMTRPPATELLTTQPVLTGLAPEAPVAAAAGLPSRLFISGHSLVDLPFPEQLAALAASAGTVMSWERQYLMGSAIRQRQAPAFVPGAQDAALITEQHGLLGTMMWNGTEQELRAWHDAFQQANPGAATYFYVPWLSLDDRHDPRRWMAYERAAAPVWQCLVTRVNSDLAAAGRADRIITIPASLALVHLVEQVVRGVDLPGVSAADSSRTMERLFADEVHLTPLGFFYVALVNYLALSGADPASLRDLLASPVVPDVTPQQALTLLAVARDFLASRAVDRKALDPASCRRFLADSFIDDYWEYHRILVRQQSSLLYTTWKQWRWKSQFTDFFRNW